MKHLQHSKSIQLIYGIAITFLVLSVIAGIIWGATPIPIRNLPELLRGFDPNSPESTIIWFVRIPRVAATVLCGCALAVSGAVIQGVLANRLASPSIIGVNAGAGLAVTICAAMGVIGGWQFSLFAFLGAFLAVMAVSLGAKKWGASRGTVILMGVAMNSLLGACSDAIIKFLPEAGILRNDFRVGDFSAVTYPKLIPAAIIIVAAIVILHTLTNELDILALGDDNAKSLGLNSDLMRTLFLLLAAALAGAAVSIAGLLSFVGLIVPHGVRRIAGSEARRVIPLCALYGAGFVTLCDTCSRILFAPYELPVGIIMAILGAPFFLFILFKGKGGHGRV